MVNTYEQAKNIVAELMKMINTDAEFELLRLTPKKAIDTAVDVGRVVGYAKNRAREIVSSPEAQKAITAATLKITESGLKQATKVATKVENLTFLGYAKEVAGIGLPAVASVTGVILVTKFFFKVR